MTRYTRVLILLLLLLATVSVLAQNGVNTPYSRYGFGLLSDRSTGFNKGMAGVAQGFRDGSGINVANPASYSGVDSLTALFDAGITFQNNNIKMGSLQKNARNTSFDYFAFHFRAARNLGIAVACTPVSNISYAFSSNTEQLGGTENVTSSYSYIGDGGLRQVFLGAGWQPFKPVSIGFNAGYVWGEYSHTTTMSFSEGTAYSLLRGYSAEISSYFADFALQTVIPVSKNDKITIGATYGLGHRMNNSAYRNTQTISSSSELAIIGETTDTIRKAFEWPTSIAAGLSYRHKTLVVGADFELQKWGSVRFPNQETDFDSFDADGKHTSSKGTLNDRYRIAVGGEWLPNPYSRHFANRLVYKIGGYYSRSYANADLTGTVTGKPVEFGLTAGVTFPITNRNLWYNSPRINVAVQWTHTNIPYLSTATMRQATMSENYLKLCLGITFSERWFYQWRVR